MDNGVKYLLDGVEFYVDNAIENVPCDKTFVGVIKGISEDGYDVEINGTLYQDVQTMGGVCSVDETVNVKIPLNNYNNMYIEKYSGDGSEGSGKVNSVNGKVGDVVLNASDVSALPNTTIIPTKTSQLQNDSSFVSDVNYVHTDNNYTTVEKNKLKNIQDGAEKNVQSDWNITDNNQDSFIKNKPTIPNKTSQLTNDSGFLNKESDPTVPSHVKAITIKNIETWNNKSNFSGSYNDLSNKPTIPTKTSQLINDNGYLNKETDPTVPSWAKSSSKPSYTKSEVGLSNVTNDSQVKRSEMGVKNGVATLDDSGKVLESQLPSYVDDVIEVDTYSKLPTTGESGKIYVTKDTNKTYRWGGSNYVVISETLALGVTSNTAYRGDFGNSAYQHSLKKSGNPHNVTKTDVGLGNVDNTADSNKNVDKVDGWDIEYNSGYTSNNPTYICGFDTNKNKIKCAQNGIVDGYMKASTFYEDGTALSSKYAPKSHTHDDRYYTESEINSKLSYKLDATNTDTRDTNENPKWYFEHYGRRSSYEFKSCSKMGLPLVNTETYCILKTYCPWGDSSGGYATQVAITNKNPLYVRYGTSDTAWSDWQKIYSSSFKPSKSDIGLGSVENKSSATIRGELTKDNVTKALGYTPPTTNTTYGVATTSELGLIKSGTDITVDGSGNVSVNDNSHSHTWENISNRPSSLPPTAHTHDDRYYTESEINTKLNGYLPKSSKAVDSDKLDGVDNTGYGRAYSSSHKFCRVGSKGTNITTAQFVEYIKTLGALNRPYWIARGSWDYAGNDKITDTGVGIIDLAGSVVEAMGNSNNYTIRITTPTTSSGGGITNAEFIYIWNGSSYKPSWRKTYNTMNKPTKSDVGLSNVPNVSTNGQTPTFNTSDSRSNINSGENLTTIFGKIRKWFTDLKTVAFSGSYNDLSNKPQFIKTTTELRQNTQEGKLVDALVVKEIEGSTGDMSNYYTKAQTKENFVYYQTEKEGRVQDANKWLSLGYALTSNNTKNLPKECSGDKDKWGVLQFVPENIVRGAGTQLFYPIDGLYKGQIFSRSFANKVPSEWMMVGASKTVELNWKGEGKDPNPFKIKWKGEN